MHGHSRGFGELVRDLAQSSTALLRAELKLARLELTGITTHVARGSAQVALGGVMLLLGGLSLAAGIVLLAGDQWLPRDRYWLAALLVVVVTGLLAAWLAKRGAAHLAPGRLAPDQTLETLREDKEWLKRQLTSDATSS
jgi:drug/metabolite transporter (DMT)-like permease